MCENGTIYRNEMENKSDHKLTLYEKIGAHLSGGFRLELPRSKEAKSIRRNSLMGLAFLAVNTFSAGAFAQDDPQQISSYEGVEGYSQMVADIESSFHQDYPEYKDRIAVFNPLGDLETQIQDIEKRLDIGGNQFDHFLQGKLEVQQDRTIAGSAETFSTPSLGTVCVASAWPRFKVEDGAYDFESVNAFTADEIQEHAVRYIHEIFHCLEDLEGSSLPDMETAAHNESVGVGFMDSGAHAGIMMARANHEHHATLGSVVLMGMNNAPVSVLTDKIAESDFNRPLMAHHTLNIAYDAGLLLRQAIPLFEGNSGALSYQLSNWRAAYDKTNEMMEAYELTEEKMIDQHIQNSVISAYIEASISPGLSQDEVIAGTIDLLRERQDILPVAQRVVQAYDYINGDQSVTVLDPVPDMGLEQIMASSLLSFKETGNHADYKAARILSYRIVEKHSTGLAPNPIYDMADDLYGTAALTYLIKNPNLLQEVASGSSLTDAYQQHRAQLDSGLAQDFNKGVHVSQRAQPKNGSVVSTPSIVK